MNLGGTLDLQVDPAEAGRRKRTRLVHLNTQTIPRLRLLGFLLVAIGALLHNAFLYPGLDHFSRAAWFRLVATLGGYSLGSWYLLYLFYEDARPRVDLGTIFLGADMAMYAVAIYFTGAQHSWVFFLPLVRVADQTSTSFRRAFAFAHLAPLSYAGVILYVVLAGHQSVSPGAELAKIAFIYFGGLYVALTARTGDRRHQRSSEVIRLARRLINELDQKTGELERSTRQLHDALDQQADLHKENARLFAATEAREARLSQILQATSDGIIFVGPDGRIEAANLRAGELLGFDPKQAIGLDVRRILDRLYSLGDGDSFGIALKSLLADPGRGGHGDVQQPATGRVFHWTAQSTRDALGNTVGLTFTLLDATPTRDLVRQLDDKSRLLESARRKADEANHARTEFLAYVSHEIEAPLGAIMDMAAPAGAPPSDAAPILRRIRSAAESLRATLGDLVDFSGIESRKVFLAREPLSLRAVMREVLDAVQTTATEKGLDLVVEVAPDVPDTLVGDAARLRQILVNLAGNALRFTDVGTVRLRVDVASRLPSEVCLHFAVIDTGVGIPRDKQMLVFEAFAQADGPAVPRSGGAGLSLSIAARLVDLMGGDIWVESEVGRGSAFRFTANFGVRAGVGDVPVNRSPAST